jgi:hypothetical protein
MRRRHRGRSGVALFAITMALAVVIGSSAALSSAVAAGGQIERSPFAGGVEGAISAAALPAKLEAALGSGFGGMWFDPSTADLHVGVSSRAGRRAAERVAARTGLSSDLVVTGVTSTWAELEAAQERWDRRLSRLLRKGEVATSLDPKSNSVDIELAARVTRSRRAALLSMASAEDVASTIQTTSSRHLSVDQQARCAAFAAGKANCDPTLVGGVTFKSAKGTCTTGPTVRIKEAKEKVEKEKTFVLTAGHCVEAAGGVGGKWFAFNKAGVEKEVGPATAFLSAETSNTDVGVVEVTMPFWAKAENPPLAPTLAPWNEAAPEPFSVIAQGVPVLEMKACVSAQISGTNCGKIIKINQTLNVGKVELTNLVEVEGVKTLEGDSGAPWYAEKQFKEAPPKGVVLGTHVGLKGATGNPVFEPLQISFEMLKKEKGVNLELLTIANEIR